MASPPCRHTVQVTGTVDLGNEARVPFSRIAVVETIDVAQKHQRVRSDQVSDQGRKPVVVTESDLVGRHGVVLVDDRHRVQCPKPVQGALGVGVLRAHRDVVRREKHLPDGAVIASECRAPRVDQRHLPDARRGLLGGQVGRPLRQSERLDPGCDRPRGHDDDVGPGLHPRLDRVGEVLQPARIEHTGRSGQRGGADLDDDRSRGADHLAVTTHFATLCSSRDSALIAAYCSSPERSSLPATLRAFRAALRSSAAIRSVCSSRISVPRPDICMSMPAGVCGSQSKVMPPIVTAQPGRAPSLSSLSSTPRRASRSPR